MMVGSPGLSSIIRSKSLFFARTARRFPLLSSRCILHHVGRNGVRHISGEPRPLIEKWFGELSKPSSSAGTYVIKDGALRKSVYNSVPEMWRQTSISIEDCRNRPNKQFWSKLEALRPPESVWQAQCNHSHAAGDRPTSVVILFTPSLMPWFNLDLFLRNVLHCINPLPSFEDPPPTSRYEILCACVDGITMKRYSHYNWKPEPTLEGVSVMVDFSGSLITFEDVMKLQETPVSTPSIMFDTWHPQKKPQISVPLANTLFLNGKQSYATWSDYSRDGKGKYKRKRHYHLDGNVECKALSRSTAFEYALSAHPVTRFRTIEAGLGNIVRTLRFDNDEIGPASRELEAVISRISEKRGGAKIDVWALIVPPGVVENIKPEHKFYLKFEWRYLGYWVNQGARLCRVVSGGGGWGPKQGLLSLDYMPNDSMPMDLLNGDMPDLATLSNQQGSVQAGSSIQFLVMNHKRARTDRRRLRIQETRKAPSFRKSISFGAVPNKIDDVPIAKRKHQRMTILTSPGHFGCVSGLGIHVQDNAYEVTTGTPESNSRPADQSQPEAYSSLIEEDELSNADHSPSTPSTELESQNPDSVTGSERRYRFKTDFKLDVPYSYVSLTCRGPLSKHIPAIQFSHENKVADTQREFKISKHLAKDRPAPWTIKPIITYYQSISDKQEDKVIEEITSTRELAIQTSAMNRELERMGYPKKTEDDPKVVPQSQRELAMWMNARNEVLKQMGHGKKTEDHASVIPRIRMHLARHSFVHRQRNDGRRKAVQSRTGTTIWEEQKSALWEAYLKELDKIGGGSTRTQSQDGLTQENDDMLQAYRNEYDDINGGGNGFSSQDKLSQETDDLLAAYLAEFDKLSVGGTGSSSQHPSETSQNWPTQDLEDTLTTDENSRDHPR